MRSLKKLFLLVSVLFIVSGCSTLPKSQTNVQWQAQQQQLSAIHSYRATGKLTYLSPSQKQSLYFQWKHSPTRSQLRLTTFLGQSVLNLTMTPQGSKVTTYNGNTYQNHDPRILVSRLTGLSIPVAQLQNWLLGQPTGADQYQQNITNTLASLSKEINGEQWALTYKSYTDETFAGKTLPLPSQLSLKQGSTTLNIVISKWVLKQ
ncbi:lipoprotein insertase outer membrane protein LolB [Vibrio profundum]|uniref:lipoprotein insertase outer membrane protein LolB n=1 Tax=Vibrio profundum TaxID=2910247 RepID=UPI003D1020ED